MPTIAQIKKTWKNQRDFFGGIGMPKEHFGREGHGLGFTENNLPNSTKATTHNSKKGEVIGHWIVDKDKNTIDFKPL